MINTEFFFLQQLKTTENRWIRQGECIKIGSEEEQKTEVVFVHVILLLIFSSSLHLRSSFTFPFHFESLFTTCRWGKNPYSSARLVKWNLKGTFTKYIHLGSALARLQLSVGITELSFFFLCVSLKQRGFHLISRNSIYSLFFNCDVAGPLESLRLGFTLWYCKKASQRLWLFSFFLKVAVLLNNSPARPSEGNKRSKILGRKNSN